MSGFCLRGVHALDESGEFGDPIDVAVAGGRIVALGPSVTTELVSFDAGGLFLLPGVFDCHDHLTFSTADPVESMATPTTQAVLETARNARATLHAGVTSVRDLGGPTAESARRLTAAMSTAPGFEPRWSCSLRPAATATLSAGKGWEGSALMIDYPGRPPIVVDGVDAMHAPCANCCEGVRTGSSLQ